MNWQTYTDSIVASGHATGAMLATHTTPQFVVAQSGQILCLAGELVALAQRIISPYGNEKILFGGVKYYRGNYMPNEYLRGIDSPRGLCVAKSMSHLVIAVYGDGQSESKCHNKVIKVAEELKASYF